MTRRQGSLRWERGTRRFRKIAAACTVVAALGCSDSKSAGPLTCAAPEAGSAGRYVLDPKDGKCKLDGTTTHVGAPCTNTNAASACGSDQNASCLDAVTDQYPGGYCNVDPCSTLDGHLCPIGASCVILNGENPQCFKDCSTDADCRTAEGYICLDLSSDPAHWISGGSHKICSKHDLICPGAPSDCPATFSRCVLPDGGDAYVDGSPVLPMEDSGVAPPTPMCAR